MNQVSQKKVMELRMKESNMLKEKLAVDEDRKLREEIIK